MLQHLSPRRSLVLKAKAILAVMALAATGATVARAADSTGVLDSAYGDSGIFSETAPSGSTVDTVSIVPGPNSTTFHLVQYWSTSRQIGAYAITQLDANGDPVTAYGTNGTVTVPVNQSDTDRRVLMMRHLGNGSMMVLGEYKPGGIYLAKFTGAGILDSTFGTGGESRTDANVFLVDGYDFTISNGGYIYVWGQNSGVGRMARLSLTGAKDSTWGGTGVPSTDGYIEAPAASNLRVIGFSIENDNSSAASVTVWGTDRTSGSDKAVIGRWAMSAGSNISNGTNRATTASWGTNNSGYVEISSSVSNAKALSYALSGYGNVYLLVGTSGTTTNRSIVAFNKTTGAAVTAFSRGTGVAGVMSLSNTASEIQIVTTPVNGVDRVYLLGTAAQGTDHYPFVEAYDSTGKLVSDALNGNGDFGANGRVLLSSCPRDVNAQAFAVASDKAVIVGGSRPTSYFALRLKDGTYNPVPTCGPASNSPQGGGGGGGGSGFTLPTLSGTIEEVSGPGIKLTVPAVAAGARLSVVVHPSSYTFGASNSEMPSGISGGVNETSVTLTKITWMNMQGQILRTTPLEVGTTYMVRYSQTIINPFASSATTVGSVALTGKVASNNGATGATTGAATGGSGTSETVSAVVPGVTVTDSKIYTAAAPKKVAASSAIAVLTPAQSRTSDIVSKTPSVCLPANDDLVFIDTGRCVAQVVSEKSGAVLRTLRTRVVKDEVSEVKVGNEIVTLAPIFFENASSDLTPGAKRRLRAIRDRVTAAGTVLLAGHTGVMLGDTPENRVLAEARAKSVANGLTAVKAKGPFYVTPVGAADPVVKSTDRDDQAKNRRVEIILVP